MRFLDIDKLRGNGFFRPAQIFAYHVVAALYAAHPYYLVGGIDRRTAYHCGVNVEEDRYRKYGKNYQDYQHYRAVMERHIAFALLLPVLSLSSVLHFYHSFRYGRSAANRLNSFYIRAQRGQHAFYVLIASVDVVYI